MLTDFKKAATAIASRARLKYAEGIQTTRLANGIEIVSHHVPSLFHPLEPRRIEFLVEVQVGRLHEKDRYTPGVSHLYEHMALRESANTPATDLGDATIPGFMGTFNATTGLDATRYFAEVDPKGKKAAMFALSDKVCRPTFGIEGLRSEQALIEAERIDETAHPSRKMSALAQSIVFKGAPGDYDVVGARDNIRNITLDDLQRFRAEHYRSGRVVVAAEGPVRHKEVVKLVEEFFALPPGDRLPPREHSYLGGYAEKPVVGSEGVTVNLGFNCGPCSGVQAQHVENLSHELARDFGRTLRQAGLAYHVSASPDTEGNITVLGVRYTTAPQDAEKALILLRDTLDEKMNPPAAVGPRLRDWLAHPVQTAKSVKPGYSHSYRDLVFHPLKTAQSLLRSRVQRRGAKNLAHTLMTTGEVPSSNRELHAYFATTAKDKANVIRTMREHPVSVVAEGNVIGFPAHGQIGSLFQLPPQAQKTAPSPGRRFHAPGPGRS